MFEHRPILRLGVTVYFKDLLGNKTTYLKMFEMPSLAMIPAAIPAVSFLTLKIECFSAKTKFYSGVLLSICLFEMVNPAQKDQMHQLAFSQGDSPFCSYVNYSR